MTNLNKNSRIKETHYNSVGTVTYQEFFFAPSKQIIDEIDRVLAKHYAFREEETDFVINYDIKYRMGKEDEDEDA